MQNSDSLKDIEKLALRAEARSAGPRQVIFTATGSQQSGERTCYRCGEKGHYANMCPTRERCNNCERTGHSAKDCRVQVTEDAVGRKRIFQEQRKGGVKTEVKFDATRRQQLETLEKTAKNLQQKNRPRTREVQQTKEEIPESARSCESPEMGRPNNSVFDLTDESDVAMYMADDPSGRGIATIRCEINSIATDCVLDTGAAVCCMSEIMADRLGVKRDQFGQQISINGIGSGSGWMSAPAAVQIAGKCIRIKFCVLSARIPVLIG